ncbi:MAG TPA: hypothetical protein VMU64_00060, partial [Acidimicrobiales bacterium]|nr:hypothetical protein [Acidimicrobiales bacterium]
MGELLDQWFARGSTRWSPTTVRNLSSIIDRHLKPCLGDVLVGDLTTAMVDDFYERLRVNGRSDGKPLGVGSVRRVHSTLHAALPKLSDGRGSSRTWRSAPAHRRACRPRCDHRLRSKSPGCSSRSQNP